MPAGQTPCCAYGGADGSERRRLHHPQMPAPAGCSQLPGYLVTFPQEFSVLTGFDASNRTPIRRRDPQRQPSQYGADGEDQTPEKHRTVIRPLPGCTQQLTRILI
jgi:hypothetical protein